VRYRLAGAGLGWAGDGELAEALDAVLGSGPTPMLRPLPVDLEEHMEGFIDDLDDPQLAGLLARAISGRDAFHRFKDTLSERRDLMMRWCDWVTGSSGTKRT